MSSALPAPIANALAPFAPKPQPDTRVKALHEITPQQRSEMPMADLVHQLADLKVAAAEAAKPKLSPHVKVVTDAASALIALNSELNRAEHGVRIDEFGPFLPRVNEAVDDFEKSLSDFLAFVNEDDQCGVEDLFCGLIRRAREQDARAADKPRRYR